uniref:Uncharacterized protein n=1 Tax=Arundo donax TaxID=35708 RepID=A0A0A9A7C2_ARUDO
MYLCYSVDLFSPGLANIVLSGLASIDI